MKTIFRTMFVAGAVVMAVSCGNQEKKQVAQQGAADMVPSVTVAQVFVQEVPQDIDMACARMKIEAMGCAIDTLSEEQYRYLHSSGV